MKLSRRGALGAGVGSAVLGAKTGIGGLREMIGPVPPPAMPTVMDQAATEYWGGESPKPIDYVAFLQEQVAKRALSRGMVPRELEELLTSDLLGGDITSDIDALRSVSQAGKRWMIQERIRQRRIDEWLKGPERQLRRALLKRTLEAMGVEI